MNEIKFKALIENSIDVIFIINTDGFVNYASSSVVKLFECKVKDIIGKNIYDFIQKDDKKHVEECIQNSIEGKVCLIKGFKIKTSKNKCKYLDGRAEAMLGIDGINGIVINCRETTDTHHLSNSIWDVFNYLNYIVIILDENLKIKIGNYYLATLLGFKDEVELKGLDWLQFIDVGEKEVLKFVHKKCMTTGGKHKEHTNDIISKDGSKHLIRWFNSAMNNGTKGTFSIGIPVTDVVTKDDDIDAVRSYFRDIIQKDKTTINALKHIK